MNDVKERVRSVISATFGVPPSSVTHATTSQTVETWDSMNHIHLIVALEAEFGVTFEPERAVELTSVPAIVDAVVAAISR